MRKIRASKLLFESQNERESERENKPNAFDAAGLRIADLLEV